MSESRGVVAAGDPQTVGAGIHALRAGGNAVDAAVAAALAAFVCEVPLCGPLGGGVMVLRRPDGATHALDMFARTPGLGGRPANLDFQGIEVSFGETSQVFHVGRGSAAAPLVLPGLLAAHRRWGTLPLPELAAPAVALGRDGYDLSDGVAFVFELLAPIAQLSPAAYALYTEHGALAQGGARLKNRPLGDVLADLARRPESVLRDLYAQLVREFGVEAGGLLTEVDLADLAPGDAHPVSLRHGPWTLRTMPGPSTGGVLVALGVRQLQGTSAGARFLSPEHVLTAVDVQRRLLQVRDHHFDHRVRDPAFVNRLLTQPLADGGTHPEPENPLGSTTHISVLDREGGAVSVTLTNGEGCGYVLTDTGIQVNNLMGEDDIHPRGFHLDAPGTPLATMMAPTVATSDTGDDLVLGSGGSNRLRNAITLTLTHLLDHGVDPRTAVDAPRMHLEATSDGFNLLFERAGLPPESIAALEAAWTTTSFEDRNMYFGGVHTATRRHGVFGGAGDHRRGGCYEIV